MQKADQMGDTQTLNYDMASRVTQCDYRTRVNSPSGTIADSDTFTFDRSGRMLTAVSGRYTNTVTMNFSLASQMTKQDYCTKAISPSGTIADSDTFTFDRSGRMLSALSGRYTNSVANVFDTLGRHKEEKLTIAGQTYAVSYDYDALGRRFKTTYPDATTVERTYTNRSQLHQTKFNGSVIDTRVYDVGGRLSTSTYGQRRGPRFDGLG